jgi:hypothetical protein
MGDPLSLEYFRYENVDHSLLPLLTPFYTQERIFGAFDTKRTH